MKKVEGGDTASARRDLVEAETLVTLERCFRLLTSGVGRTTAATGRRNSVPTSPSGSANNSGSASSKAGTLLGRCLRRSVFEAIKHRVTCMDHNLFDVIWPALKKYSNAYASSNANLDQISSNVRERRFDLNFYLFPRISLTLYREIR